MIPFIRKPIRNCWAGGHLLLRYTHLACCLRSFFGYFPWWHPLKSQLVCRAPCPGCFGWYATDHGAWKDWIPSYDFCKAEVGKTSVGWSPLFRNSHKWMFRVIGIQRGSNPNHSQSFTAFDSSQAALLAIPLFLRLLVAGLATWLL